MKVLKFGGTSVASAASIKQTVSILGAARSSSDKICVVVSALSGVTDHLIAAGIAAAEGRGTDYLALLKTIEEIHLLEAGALFPLSNQSVILSRIKQLLNELDLIVEGVYTLGELSARSQDRIMAFGEILSSTIISHYMASSQMPHEWADSRLLIKTNFNYGNGIVDAVITNLNISKKFNASAQLLWVLPGFVASAPDNSTTTLGRGGSDYTAALIAAACNAEELQIWTDVSGMMTADPRLCVNAKVVPHITYQEAMELSHFGAKVIYPPTIQPVMNLDIPIRIKNTFAPDDLGTLIERTSRNDENIVCGLSSMSKMSILLLEGSGMIGIPGFSKRLFDTLSKEKINVILITQSSSEHSICVAIDEKNSIAANAAVNEEFSNEILLGKLIPLQIENDLSIIALVGDEMKSHPGISGKMFSALGRNGINIRAIAQGSSEKNISAVIRSKDVKKAINVLHEVFFESTKIQVNLFIIGVGNVGSKLLNQLDKQSAFLHAQLRTQVRVVGLANSKTMLLNEDGIDLASWQEKLGAGNKMEIEKFIEFITEKNLRNSIFVDNTASSEVPLHYSSLLKKSVSVVACNKVAASSDITTYNNLKKLASEYNTSFLFETNVGAGLPVIGTLNDLLNSGDEITKIQAVLSGTLTFVFNNYDGTKPFYEVVKQAQDEGYTEPDPRIDLSGIDVMRKILILARESGLQINIDEIANNGFLPESCMNGDVNNFYEELKKHEEHFKKIYKEASEKNCRLKFVAQLESGKASVGLQHIDNSHDLYHLYGKDNVVLFYTKRYSEQPLVIKGAGAGAEVTASGIFADIMRAAKGSHK